MAGSASPTGRRLASATAAVLVALALAGCASRDATTTGSTTRAQASRPVDQLSAGEVRSEVETLGVAYTRDTRNKPVAMRYASLLQLDGRAEQALAVMRKLAIDLPKDREVLAAYGKSLAAAGQLQPALDAIQRAQTPEYPDWRLVSAEAAILDQLGQPAPARELYRRAIAMKPGEPSVLSNLGMSYLLEGDLKQAETYMRQASTLPGADSRVRQNLALVVGLQGRFKEAEEIARAELSPQQAQANVDYLRSMLSQQNAWKQLEREEKRTN